MNIEEYQKKSFSNSVDIGLVQNAIKIGVSYLKSHQYPYGEFCSYYAPDDAMQEWCVPHSSIFPTALIVNSLLSLSDDKNVKEIFRKAVSFFQYQTMRGGAMNYFAKWNQFFSMCPADIDDTIFVADFLKSQGIEFVDPLPILLENRNKNGLFYTWFSFRFNTSTNKDYWLLLLREFKHPIKSFLVWKNFEFSRYDVDAVVNTNVLYFLGRNNITKPIIDYLLKIVEENRESDCDKWYRNPFTFYYFYSRNVKKGITELNHGSSTIINRIINNVKPNGCIGSSALETALSTTALINLNFTGPQIDNGIKFILDNQQKTGEWPRRIMYYSGPKKLLGWGSEELTTGFCIETLALYSKYKNTYQNDTKTI